jgi:hypothetical protein
VTAPRSALAVQASALAVQASALAVQARLPLARLARSPRGWAGVGLWSVLALGMAAMARAEGATHGADRVLLEGFGAYALPLVAYALVGATLGARSMGGSVAPLVAIGASPGPAAAAAVAVAAAACTSGGAVLAGMVALIAHGSGDPPALRDALTSAYAGGLGGLAYASWFSLGASVGRRGGGRVALLVVDFVLSGSGVLEALTPRAHVRSLLGGALAMDLPERGSALMLGVLAIGYGFAAVRRASR